MEDDEWDDAAWAAVAMEADLVESTVVAERQDVQPTSVLNDQWTCSRCTLHNPVTLSRCSVCDFARTAPRQPQPASSDVNAPSRSGQSMSSWLVPSKQPAPAKTHRGNELAPPRGPVAPPPSASTRPPPPPHAPSPAVAPPPPRPRSTLALPTTQTTLAFLPNPMEIPEESVVMGAEIDRDLATQWIYPSNYPVRAYQQTISRAALLQNTLVCLPTGLGKTLIAAVVMYNFHRWFRRGKIVFMAPTKPLVSQQIQACHDVMPIPQSDMAELQGNVAPAKRKELWATKRVFFCTPQSLQNDIERGNCDVRSFVCVVVDEAHRATGNYAYVNVIKAIAAKISGFRVLALSATPGAKFDVIQDVLTNLRISHIECKNADDPDVRMYTHSRQEEIIKCRMNTEVTGVRTQYIKLFQPILHRLCSSQVLHIRDPEKLSRWVVITSRDKMRANPNGGRPYRTAEADLALLISLLHGKDILTVHGIGNFKAFLDKFAKESFSGPKKLVLESPEYAHLVTLVNAQIGGGRSASNNPKLVQLQHVLSEHFTRHEQGGSNTRCIVFTQYRESVTEIVALLATMAPLIKVQQFIGQGTSKGKEGKGQTQKQQQEVVAKFRDGHFNVLVATCIAEEGLDIGEVDLIVSFDCLTSPVRMIQRMGRTGRKRVGRVVLLVTEGDEEKKLERSVSAAKSVNRSLTIFKDKFKCVPSARMIPTGIVPRLTESSMTVPTFQAALIGGKKGAKKGPVNTMNDWLLNEDENQVLHLKHPGQYKRRTHLFSVMLPLRLTDFSKPHHFGKSRRSRCLLQLLHRVQERDRMTNAEFAHRFRHALALKSAEVVRNPPSHLSPQVDAFEGAPDDPSMHLDVEEDVFQQSFPLSYDGDDGMPMSAEPMESRAVNAAADIAQGDTMSVDQIHEDGHVIEIPSSPEGDIASPSVTAEPSPARPQSPRPAPSGIFSLFHRTGAPVIASPPPKPKSKLPSTAKTTSSPAVKRKQSPHKTIKSSPHSANVDGRSKKTASGVACVLMSSSLKQSPTVKPQMNLTLDVSVGILQQGEQVISMLEQLSALEMASPETKASSQLTPKTPSLSPQQSSSNVGGLPRKALPRLYDSRRPLPALVSEKVAVPEAPKKKPPTSPPDAAYFNRASSFGLDNSPEVVDVTASRVSIEAHAAEQRQSTDSARVSTPAVQPDSTGRPSDVFLGGARKVRPAKKSLQTAFALDNDHDDPSKSMAAALARKANDSAFSLPPMSMEQGGGVAARKRSRSTQSPSAKTGAASRPSPGLGSHPVGGEQGVASKGAASSKQKQSVLRVNTPRLDDDDDDDFVSATVATPSQRVRKSAVGRHHPGTPVHDNCQVCGDDESTESDPILFCDGCNVAVHQHCYGVATIPPHDWFCDACQDEAKPTKCVLCPVQKGALKQTLCRQWVHVQCFLWIPELVVRMQQGGVIGLGSLETLDAERFALKCEVCHTGHGFGIVQCAHRSCLKAFHVSCASGAKYQLIQAEGVESAQFLVYCPMHMSKREAATSTHFLSPSDGMFDTPGSDQRRRKPRKRLRAAADKSSARLSSPSGTRRPNKRKASKQLISHYIEMEAEADEDNSADEDDEEGQLMNSSFIDDGSPSQFLSPESMQAIYRRRESTSPPLVSRFLPANGVVAACLQQRGEDMDTSIDMGEVLHHGIACNECQLNPIEGVRYQCQRCPFFNLCMCCYSAREDFHPRDHRFSSFETTSQASPTPPRPPPHNVPIPRPAAGLSHRNHIHDGSRSVPGARARPVPPPAPLPPPPQIATPTTLGVSAVEQRAKTAAELTADQVARMEESRRKALELKRKRLEQSHRMQATDVPPPPIPAAPLAAPCIAPAIAPTSTAPESTRQPMASAALPTAPPPVASAVEATTPDMPSFSLLPSFNLMASVSAPARLGYSIAYHPRIRSSSLLLHVFGHDALPKVAEESLDCDLLLSARRPVQVMSFNELSRQIHLPQCPHWNVLAAYGSLTYLVQSSPHASPQAIQECTAYAAKYTGMDIQWTGDPGHTLRLVLDLSGQDAAQGHALSQYDGGRGKDSFYMDRWRLFHSVPHLPFGGQQALTNRFPHMSVEKLVQMGTRFNPMHWKRMLPWVPDPVAHAIDKHVKSQL